MDWLSILKTIAYIILTLVCTGCPSLVAFLKARNKRKDAEIALQKAEDDKAKAEAEAAKAAAEADLRNMAQAFIESMEVTFAGFDKMMKAQGSSAGPIKKDMVSAKLQAYALQNNYEYDVAVWDEKIDELVKFTKKVNTNTTQNKNVAI